MMHVIFLSTEYVVVGGKPYQKRLAPPHLKTGANY